MKKTKIIAGLFLAFILVGIFLLSISAAPYEEFRDQAVAYSRKGDDENAVKYLEKAITAYEQDEQDISTRGEYFLMRGDLGFAYMRLGQKEKGQQIFDKASDDFDAFMEEMQKSPR